MNYYSISNDNISIYVSASSKARNKLCKKYNAHPVSRKKAMKFAIDSVKHYSGAFELARIVETDSKYKL